MNNYFVTFLSNIFICNGNILETLIEIEQDLWNFGKNAVSYLCHLQYKITVVSLEILVLLEFCQGSPKVL